jgi:3-oxoacyl-[acyl-carrier-protein] synthase III
MPESHLAAVSVMLPPPTPTTPDEVASVPEWRAVSADPGAEPLDMAVEAGRAALGGSGVAPDAVDWLIHTGSGHQGVRSWPMHHAVQSALLGSRGNAIEVRQFCAGGLTSWVLADRMRITDRAVVCTAADNWSWTDRFALSRRIGGEPFADVASAAVIGADGFARMLGSGNASQPEHAAGWRADDPFWTDLSKEQYRDIYASALRSRDRAMTRATATMIGTAITGALADASLSAADVTHFVPPSSRTGEPYRVLAHHLGLPWNDGLYQLHLEHGYLSVSAPAAGLVTLARDGALSVGDVVLLTATEYNTSCTAVALRVVRTPSVTTTERVGTVR